MIYSRFLFAGSLCIVLIFAQMAIVITWRTPYLYPVRNIIANYSMLNQSHIIRLLTAKRLSFQLRGQLLIDFIPSRTTQASRMWLTSETPVIPSPTICLTSCKYCCMSNMQRTIRGGRKASFTGANVIRRQYCRVGGQMWFIEISS